MSASPLLALTDDKVKVADWLAGVDQYEIEACPEDHLEDTSTACQQTSSADEDMPELTKQEAELLGLVDERALSKNPSHVDFEGILDPTYIFRLRLRLLETAMFLDGFGATALSHSLGSVLNRFWESEENNLLTVEIWNLMIERQGKPDEERWPLNMKMSWLDESEENDEDEDEEYEGGDDGQVDSDFAVASRD